MMLLKSISKVQLLYINGIVKNVVFKPSKPYLENPLVHQVITEK